MTSSAQLHELLYQKRYSLMFENGDRWVDLRRYGLLLELPLDRPGDVIYTRFRIPVSECQAHTTPPAGCTVGPSLP